MNRSILTLVCLAALFLQGCSSLWLSGHRNDFVQVHGLRFVCNDRPYFYVGTNMWYGCYLGSSGSTGDRTRLTRELDSLALMGIVNLRVLGASQNSYLKNSIRPAVQQAPGKVDDSLLVGLDFLLDEMGKRDMHAVIYLNNYWQWSGGMSQYNVWANGSIGADPDDPRGGYGPFMDFSASFYANATANALYRALVWTIITRKNTINGRHYADDPVIMAWQLANEPRPGRENGNGLSNLPAFYAWLDQTAAFIHSIDTNHLVSTGSEGTIGALGSADFYAMAHSSPHIDYLTFHLWPFNWGWFDPKRIDETLPISEEKAIEYIGKHIALARQLKKPIVMEEFGMARDSANCMPGAPSKARDHYYQRILDAVYDSAWAGAPIVGSNFWTWGGQGAGRAPDFRWQKGDPFLGDPPQEPQGYNSICFPDSSTLGILRSEARKMQMLNVDAGETSAEDR